MSNFKARDHPTIREGDEEEEEEDEACYANLLMKREISHQNPLFSLDEQQDEQSKAKRIVVENEEFLDQL